MKKLLSLSLLGLIAAPLWAADKVDQTLDVEPTPVVEVKVLRGEVEFRPWDEAAIRVQGTLDELSEGLVLTKDAGRVLLEDKLPKHWQGNNSQGSALVIYVPKNLTLSADGISTNTRLAGLSGTIGLGSVSGTIEARDLNGELNINTVSGDITTSTLKGSVSLESVSGRISDDNNAAAEVHYKAVSGDINAATGAERVQIEQVSGDTELAMTSVGQLDFRTVSGDARLAVPGEISVRGESVSGDIALSFAQSPNIDVKINGGPGGRIINKLSDEKPQKPKYGPGSSLKMRLGDGKGMVRLSTISGKLALE